MKSIVLAAAAIIGLSTAASAAEAPLPPTYLIHKLSIDGVRLKSLEPERGAYEAKVWATDGSVVKVGVDPLTGDLTDAYSHARSRAAAAPAPAVDAAAAIQAVAMTGHWDVRAVEYDRGAWQVAAADDGGQVDRFAVDGATGTVR